MPNKSLHFFKKSERKFIMLLRSFLSLFVFCYSLVAAENRFTPFSKNSEKTTAHSVLINGKEISSLVVEINAEELSAMKSSSVSFVMNMPLLNDKTVELQLAPFEIFDEETRFLEGTESGDKPFLAPDAKFFSGNISNDDASFAYVGIINNQIYAFVNDRTQTFLMAQKQINGKNEYVIFREEDVTTFPQSFDCGSDELEVPNALQNIRNAIPTNVPYSPNKSASRAFIAMECDYEYYAAFFSLDTATAYLLNLVGVVSSIYEDEIGVRLRLPYVRIWTTKKDPWGGKSTTKALNELLKFWNSYMTGIQRTFVHLISGKAINATSFGGLAYIDVIAPAAKSFAYGVSQIRLNLVPFPTYSWDAEVVAHELGHNFGSQHTHNCVWNPPIDSCYASEGGCYSGTVARKGTIMSYCHLTSAGLDLTFGTRVGNYLSGHVDSFLVDGSNYFNTSFRTFIAESLATMVTANPTSPNTADAVNEVFHKKRLPVGIVLGIEQPKETQKIYGWMRISSAKAAKKFFPQTSRPTGFTFVKEKKDPTSAKYNNRLAAQLLATKFNMTASLFGTFPFGFERLKYRDPGHPFHNMRLDKLTQKVDSLLTYPSGADTNLYYAADSVLKKINAAFAGALVVASTSPIKFSGVANVSSFDFLRIDTSTATIFPQIASRSEMIPETHSLLSNYPNPFNPKTVIRFQLSAVSDVSLKIYNIIGEEVAILLNNDTRAEGEYALEFDATNFPSGMYVSRLQVEGKIFSQKMVLMK